MGARMQADACSGHACSRRARGRTAGRHTAGGRARAGAGPLQYTHGPSPPEIIHSIRPLCTLQNLSKQHRGRFAIGSVHASGPLPSTTLIHCNLSSCGQPNSSGRFPTHHFFIGYHITQSRTLSSVSCHASDCTPSTVLMQPAIAFTARAPPSSCIGNQPLRRLEGRPGHTTCYPRLLRGQCASPTAHARLLPRPVPPHQIAH